MKSGFRILVSALVLGTCVSTAFAAEATPAEGPKPTTLRETGKANESLKGLKVAFVDVQKAILMTEEGKHAREAIEKEAKKKREEIVNQEKELKAMNDEFQAQQAVLSESAKAEKQKEFQKRYEGWQAARMGFEQEFREREMKETQRIIDKMGGLIEELARKRGYDFVFERGSGALLFAARIDDLTEELVAAYNSKNKAKK